MLLFALLLPGLSTAQSDDMQHRKDSLRNAIAIAQGYDRLTTYKQLMDIYFLESATDNLKMDTLLAICQDLEAEALRQREYDFQGYAMQIRMSAHKNRKEFAQVRNLAPDYLVYLAKYEVWTRYYAIYRNYIESYLEMGEYNKAIEEAQRMYSEAQQRGHDAGKGESLHVMAFIYSKMNRLEEEERYTKECIEVIKKVDDVENLREMAYFRLCYVLTRLGRFEEALLQASEYEKIIIRNDEHLGAKRTPSWINLWRIYMFSYARIKDFDQVELYCNKIDSICTPAMILYDLYSMRAQIFHNRKQYDQALEMVDKAFEVNAGNPFQIHENIEIKLQILCAMRESEDIHELMKRWATLNDSIRNSEFNAKLDELRTVYEVDKITEEKVRNLHYFLFALGGCLLLAITLTIWISYSRMVVRKNRGLYQKIKELDRFTDGKEGMHSVSTTEKATEAVNPQQCKLVNRLHEYLLLNKNYLNPEMEREWLVSELATNKTYLFEAVKAVTGKSLQDYINYFRLEEARRLFDHHTDFKIEVLAEKCGFVSYRSFYRAFRDQFKMNPTEYRKIANRNK